MFGLYLAAVALVGGAAALHLLARRAEGRFAKTIRLSPSAALHVVELDGRRLLVGTGPSSAPSLLAELSPVEPETGGRPAASLGMTLTGSMRPGVRSLGLHSRARGGEVQDD